MKKYTAWFFLLTYLIFPPAVAESGWFATVKVVKIVGTANGGINVLVTPSLTSCISQSGYGPNYASLYPTHPGKDKITSLLIAAYMGDKPVSLYLTDKDCTIGEVILGG